MPADVVRYMSMNGRIVEAGDARVHILSPAMKYAANVFEGIRGYWNEADGELHLFRLDDHLRRLRFSMKVLRFGETFDLDHLRRCVVELIRANELRQDTYVRMFAYVDAFDGEMTATEPVGLAIAATPRGRRAKGEAGLDCAVASWLRIADPALPARIKCVANYVNSRLAWTEARANGYDNVLLLNQRGKVSEGPGACVFLVRDGVPITPGVTSDILESVTRATVIRMLDEGDGLRTVERDVDRTELYAADEVFFAGTGHEILPIVTIDRLPVGSGEVGPIARSLRERYAALVRGETADHPEWRTPVYAAGA